MKRLKETFHREGAKAAKKGEDGLKVSKCGIKSQNWRNFCFPSRLRGENGLPEGGFTLVELMIAVAILGIIMPAMILLLSKTRQSFSADEMHMQLEACNEQTINRVHLSLSSNRHIYEGDAAGVSFLGLVQFPAGTPPVLTGSKLPQLMTSVTGSLSPNSTGFLPANIGNSIFFLAYDAPETYLPSVGPATITTAPATIVADNSSAAPQTVIIDLYRFYYYYLSTANPHSASSFPSYGLVEWQSIQYGDYQELASISDPTLQPNVTTALMSRGVSFAVDPTATAPASLFHDIQTSGVSGIPDSSVSITQFRYSFFRTQGNGILSSGFWYGISPNSALWTQQTAAPAKVPLYATASSAFPGGFEVGLSGPNAGREIMLHSVLVAKGSAPKVEVDDMNTVVDVRDE